MTKISPFKVHIILLSILGLSSVNTYACDPVALNWQQFYTVNDRNRDKIIQQQEWQQLSFKGSNYDSGFVSIESPQQIFQHLDKNHNAVLEEQELFDIYNYLNNPCADFDSQTNQSQTSMWDRVQKFIKQILD